MDHVNLKLPITEPIDVDKAEEAIKADPDIAVVYCCHHETGTGIPVSYTHLDVYKRQLFFCLKSLYVYDKL